MKLIAFTGKKRSGKSTCADWLVNKGFKKLNFKDALIAEIKTNFPDLLKVIGDDFENKTDAMRALMQNYGTEVRRKDNEYYWIEQWIESYLPIENDNVVVDDCRFLNEASVIKNFDGIIIRVIRHGFNGDEHQSETEQDSISPDYEIVAETLDELYKKLGELYENINKID